jgi:hypothetical protein
VKSGDKSSRPVTLADLGAPPLPEARPPSALANLIEEGISSEDAEPAIKGLLWSAVAGAMGYIHDHNATRALASWTGVLLGPLVAAYLTYAWSAKRDVRWFWTLFFRLTSLACFGYLLWCYWP